MSLHRFEHVQTLPIGLDEAWAFFSDPANLGEITPPEMGFDVTSELPEVMYSGLIVTYRVRPLFGIAVNWATEIKHVEPLVRFVDEQRMGPYALWHHQHLFEAVLGGTTMRDIVHYAVPLGPLGDLVNARLVAPRVRAIFDYRRGVLDQRFGSAALSGVPS